MPFHNWILRWPCFDQVPLTCPDGEFLCMLSQLVLYDYRAFASQEAALRQQQFRHKLVLDRKERGSSWSFLRVKPDRKPSFEKVSVSSCWEVEQICVISFACRRYRLLSGPPLELLSEVLLAGCRACVSQVQDRVCTLVFPADQDMALPLHAVMSQQRVDCTCEGVQASLAEYWQPIWCRDSRTEEHDIASWSKFQDLLATAASPCLSVPVDMTCCSAWLHVVRRLDRAKATGVSGWSNSELRDLPEAAVEHLALIFSSAQYTSYPSELMQARVAVLSKVYEPDSPGQARPITIFCNLFRLWARVFCIQVLTVWSQSLPLQVQGSLRRRSAPDMAYWLMQQSETALLARAELHGFALDLRKVFNFLPRAPLRALLVWLGIPSHLVNFWVSSLSAVTRCFQIRGSLSPGVPSTTGAPEGDPVSVLGMIAVCVLYVSSLRKPPLKFLLIIGGGVLLRARRSWPLFNLHRILSLPCVWKLITASVTFGPPVLMRADGGGKVVICTCRPVLSSRR